MQSLRTKWTNWKRGSQTLDLSDSERARRKELDKHRALATGVAQFLRDFIVALDQVLTAFARFIDLVKNVDPSWFDNEADRAKVQVQTWALAMGLKATAPLVTSELQRHLKRLETLRKAAVDVQGQLQTRDQRHQDMNHYVTKLSSLLEERTRHEKAGRAVPPELNQKIQRNQAKLQRSESDLLNRNSEANACLKKELENRGELLKAFMDVTQCITCGFFVSTGAVVCRAIHEAETEAAWAAEDEAARASRTSPAPGVLALPPSMATEVLQPPEAFDAKDPLKTTTIPQPSAIYEPVAAEDNSGNDVAAKGNSGAQCEAVATEDLERLPVRRLRELLDSAGISHQGCVEKADLVKLLQESKLRQDRLAAPNRSSQPCSQQAGYPITQAFQASSPPPPPAHPATEPQTQSPMGSPGLVYDSDSDMELQAVLLASMGDSMASCSAPADAPTVPTQGDNSRSSELVPSQGDNSRSSEPIPIDFQRTTDTTDGFAGHSASATKLSAPSQPPESMPRVFVAASSTASTATSPGAEAISWSPVCTEGSRGSAESTENLMQLKSSFSTAAPVGKPPAYPVTQSTSTAWHAFPPSPGPPAPAEASSKVEDTDLLGLFDK